MGEEWIGNVCLGGSGSSAGAYKLGHGVVFWLHKEISKMAHLIPIWIATLFLILLILAFIFGYSLIKRYNEKEKEKELMNDEIRQIWK